MILLRHSKKGDERYERSIQHQPKAAKEEQAAKSGAAGSDNGSIGAGGKQMGVLGFP